MKLTTIGNVLAIAAAIALGGVYSDATAGTILAEWTFEGNAPADLSNSTIGPSVSPPNTGTGTLNGVHASAATDWSTPAGNGSAESYSVNTWAIGDYFQFSTSSIGSDRVKLSFDATGSGTGPTDFKVQYSLNGSTFTDTGSTYKVLLNGGPAPSWSSMGTRAPEYTSSFDFSSIPALGNAASIYFRLVNTTTASIGGGTVAAGGTSRIDNVQVVGVPEPASLALLGLAGLACVGAARRRS
jgi:hypothetical protein